jgi:acyl-CoA thioesterase FadM
MDEIKNKVFSMSYTIEREGTLCALGMSKSVCAEPGVKKAVLLPHPFVAKVRQYEEGEPL